ncbi:hypothetical protein DNH61_25270 [Paenibacillus sambharensis]|uniref:Uncharacterized protein n=1 Tax=Paenibacillus sambharensis TaxID=1803190 RepID=A0A2W1LDE5_9BACL|nr:hypothetical protein [Paenibacillus sambharensis]PZD93092.1 hypothetical protein DNH61_25270 [Paenibacillus sambharensis]
MIVTMTREKFDRLEDERLGWLCVEQTLMFVRGRDAKVKKQAMGQLSDAQRAACMFRVLYDHAKPSAAEYYGWIAHLLDTPGYWDGVTSGIRFFTDEDMLMLLEESKAAVEAECRHRGITLQQVSMSDLDANEELNRKINGLYERFLAVSEQSHTRIANYIRSNPSTFVHLT